ncbi:hypothetical protein Patl1_18948 [Pistacia atlantica]|uniref:Uncharacterized protein n=1 Tax=Pistacia atlantica TaxID=434234 RepID=A0ACC1BXR4_9ROSI|nr:hypothetical protein Patl1_18948 [Pistacia atlantica]
MKKEPLLNLKRLVEFLGQPFSLEEEENRIVHEIVRLCSFENMKNLEVNKTGIYRVQGSKNNIFFREGKVRDCKNHLTTEMMESLDQITEQKFHASG